jgi:hypothetical protein
LFDLGQVMETSPEMHMLNYMAYDPLDFPSSVKRLPRLFGERDQRKTGSFCYQVESRNSISEVPSYLCTVPART